MNLLEDYIAAGLNPETFWRITPKEMIAHFAGAARRAKVEQKRLAWAAYQTAALTRTDKFPRFSDFIGDKPARTVDPMSKLRMIADRLPKHKMN